MNATDNSLKESKAISIKVPKIYWKLTRSAVLTMEWLDGIKLTDENRLRKACLNRKRLIDEVPVVSCINIYSSGVHFNFLVSYGLYGVYVYSGNLLSSVIMSLIVPLLLNFNVLHLKDN